SVPLVYGTTDGGQGGTSHMAVGDLDGDNDADVVLTSFGTLEVFLNQGNGTFAPEVAYSTGGYYAQEFKIGDVNADGAPDLVALRGDIHAVCVLRNLGNGTFTVAVTYPAGRFGETIALNDLDGNGFPDLAIESGYSDSVTVLRNAGDGSFGPPYA